MIKVSESERKSIYEEIIIKGYDIKMEIYILQDFWINKFK